MNEPPRVSIRRRMACTLADVACADYDRWYILAHSLGSVVAFNGLMEPGYVFPNYLDRNRWRRLVRKGFGGRADDPPPTPGAKVTPARPEWLGPTDIADRPALYGKFKGLMTYGCPLGKFADIWPALVPFCREPAFSPATLWINVFDPLDPVSGPMDNFDLVGQPGHSGLLCCPNRYNLGYAASPLILKGHVEYMTRKPGGDLTSVIADWLVRRASPLHASSSDHVFRARSPRARRRYVYLALQWTLLNVAVALGLGLGLGAVVRYLLHSPGLDWRAFAFGVFFPPLLTFFMGLSAHLAPWIFTPDADAEAPAPSRPGCRPAPVKIAPLQPIRLACRRPLGPPYRTFSRIAAKFVHGQSRTSTLPIRPPA